MGPYQRLHCLYGGRGILGMGVEQGVYEVGLRHLHLEYLPMTRRQLCPPLRQVGEGGGPANQAVGRWVI